MSTCTYCSSPNFVLNRQSGQMTCSNCGRENYIGSPTDYTPLPEFKFNKKTGEMDRTEFFPNTDFADPKD